MIRKKFLCLCLFFGSLMAACVDDALDQVGGTQAVVAGYIYSNEPIDSLRIFESNSYLGDTTLNTIDSIIVEVISDDEVFALSSLGSGYYYDPDAIVRPGQSYMLSFVWNGQTVLAETYVPVVNEATVSDSVVYREQVSSSGFGGPGGLGAPADNIEVSWDNAQGDYYYVLVENIEEAPEFINSRLAELLDAQGLLSLRRVARTEPEIVDFYVINTTRDIQQFGRHRVVIYRLNPEYAALYERTGTSSITIQAPPTNVENGLGIFTGISTDTVYFEVKKW